MAFMYRDLVRPIELDEARCFTYDAQRGRGIWKARPGRESCPGGLVAA